MNNNKSLNIIAKFFNTYEIIDFDDSKIYEEQKKDGPGFLELCFLFFA